MSSEIILICKFDAQEIFLIVISAVLINICGNCNAFFFKILLIYSWKEQHWNNVFFLKQYENVKLLNGSVVHFCLFSGVYNI